MSSTYTFDPVGRIHSCFHEKFGVPRQSGLVTSATAQLEFLPPYHVPDMVRGLEAFSHVWVVFVFNASLREHWKPLVRPPRLGGNERVGVFASRSNFRPNPIGLSVCRLDAVHMDVSPVVLHLSGGDFLDGTPVLDVKPYLPYADARPDAAAGYAPTEPQRVNEVAFEPGTERAIRELEGDTRPALRPLIEDMLGYNVRPAYQSDDPDRIFGTMVFDLNIRWKQAENRVYVVSVEPKECD